MNTDDQTLHTVQTFLKALGIRDLNAITELFADQVDWYIPGDQKLAPWLGKRSNKQEVKDFFTTLWLATEPLSAKIDHLLVNGKDAVVVGEFSSKMLATGKVVDSLFHIQLTVENGVIKRYRLLEDSLAVFKALSKS